MFIKVDADTHYKSLVAFWLTFVTTTAITTIQECIALRTSGTVFSSTSISIYWPIQSTHTL